jgi:hypothetical protein
MTAAIRGPLKTDVPYIMDSWLSSIRPIYRQLPDDIFFPAYRQLIKRVIASSDIRVLAEGDRILGYAVSWNAEGVLHWLYLRNPNEEQAKLLLSPLPEKPAYTFKTRQGRLLYGELQEGLLRRLKDHGSSESNSSHP